MLELYYISKILIVLVVIIIIAKFLVYKKENFNLEYGGYCKKCEGRTFGNCLTCANCGYCFKNGEWNCVSGDVHGPYNKDCDIWYNNDSYYIYNEKMDIPWQYQCNMFT